jgi:phosphoribosylformylglycinamidine synthase
MRITVLTHLEREGSREYDAVVPRVVAALGRTVKEPRLRIVGASGEWVVWANLADLKEAWQRPLRW